MTAKSAFSVLIMISLLTLLPSDGSKTILDKYEWLIDPIENSVLTL